MEAFSPRSREKYTQNFAEVFTFCLCLNGEMFYNVFGLHDCCVEQGRGQYLYYPLSSNRNYFSNCEKG